MTVAARAPDPLLGRQIGKFAIEEKLGEGGMGAVYKARDTTLDRMVALKLIRPELLTAPDAVQRFQREARVTGKFQHPNVVQIHEVGETPDGLRFMALEFVDGGELRSVLRRDGALPPHRALRLIIQVLAALGEAHRAGIVHRDLKPQNIMVGPGDKVKLLDFGIARPQQEGATLTLHGQIVGTVAYMSPEQVVGARLDGRSDLYAAGVVLFQMLTGRLPFAGAKPIDVMEAHRDQPPPRLRSIRPDLPEVLEPVIARALEKEPEQRWQTAEEMITALEALGLIESVRVPFRAPGPPAPPPPPAAPTPSPVPAGNTPISQAYDTGSTEAFYQHLVGKRLGEYLIEAQLGEGGMGAVFRAKDPLLGNTYAIKVIHPNVAGAKGVRERFLREARAAQEVVHPNAVAIRGCHAAEGGLLYMVLDFCPGETLRSVLRREGRIGVERALGIVRQALLALGEAHAKGIVHRDLKPENLMLQQESSGDDWVRVVDFGLAKLRDAPDAGPHQESLTGNQILGTPHYMSPEQVSGQCEVDGRSDIYALGCVLYELLTGARPFVGQNAIQVMNKHVLEQPVPLGQRAPEAGIPPEVDALVLQAMAKLPAQRFQSAEELVLAIDRLGYRLPGRLNRTSANRLRRVEPGSGVTPLTAMEEEMASAPTLASAEAITAPPAHIRAPVIRAATDQTLPPSRKAPPTERREAPPEPAPPPPSRLGALLLGVVLLAAVGGAGVLGWRYAGPATIASGPERQPELPPIDDPPPEDPGKAAAERAAAEKAEADRLAAERLAAEKAEADRLAAERLAAEKAEADRLAAEKAEVDRLAAERLAAEEAEADRLAAERLAAEKAEADRLAAERRAAEKAEADRLAADRLAGERRAAEKAEADRLAADRLAAERRAAEKAEADRLAADRLAAERLAAEKAEADRLAAEKAAAAERPTVKYLEVGFTKLPHVAEEPISVRQYGWFAFEVQAGRVRVDDTVGRQVWSPLRAYRTLRRDGDRDEELAKLPAGEPIVDLPQAVARELARFYDGRLPTAVEWLDIADQRQNWNVTVKGGANLPEWLEDSGATGLLLQTRKEVKQRDSSHQKLAVVRPVRDKRRR